MPRDIGTGLYHYPDGTPGNAGQTVFSARYNTFINDLSNTLNQALPVNMGGTGGVDAATARTNLDASVAGAHVTNFATHVFENGTYYSDSDATDGPLPAQALTGTSQVHGNPQFVTLTARGTGDGKFYTRFKNAGSWQPWAEFAGTTAELDARYVNVTGDTMTGDLTITKVTNPQFILNKTADVRNMISGQKNGLNRWQIQMGNETAEAGSNAGSNFSISRYNDAGTFVDSPLQIVRSTGNVGVTSTIVSTSPTTGALTVTGGLGVGEKINMGNGTMPAIGSYLRIGVATGFSNIATRPGDDAGQWHHAFENAAGSVVGAISTSATNTAYGVISDADLKEDLKSFDAGNIIDNTNVYDFKWKSTQERAYGVIAQQANEVYPTAVIHAERNEKDNRDEWWGIDYSKYVPVLLQELKALRARVAELEAKLESKPA